MFQGSMVAVATPMQKGNAPETPLDKESLAGLWLWVPQANLRP